MANETYNALVGFPSWRAKATFTASSEIALYPASNLGTVKLARVWRTPDATPVNTKIYVEIVGQKRLIELVVLCRHNLSLGSTVTVKLYEDAAKTVLLTTVSAVVWPQVFTEDQVDWDGGRWWDRSYTAEEIEGYPWNFPIRIPGNYYCQAIDIEISDELNPAGFVEVGMVELASEHQFPVNFDVGASAGYVSRNITREADGGSEYHRERPMGRVFQGSVSYMDRQVAKGVIMEMRRQLNTNKPFFWWPNPEDDINFLRDAWLARFEELSLHSYAEPIEHDSVPIRLKEFR